MGNKTRKGTGKRLAGAETIEAGSETWGIGLTKSERRTSRGAGQKEGEKERPAREEEEEEGEEMRRHK